MSAEFGLVKFKKTGNIYFCCYEGTSDTLLPFICTAEECYDETSDGYWAITYCRDLRERRRDESWEIPKDTADLDEVEIYITYGGEWCMPGIGSESLRMVNGILDDDYELDYSLFTRECPSWAKEFLDELEKG